MNIHHIMVRNTKGTKYALLVGINYSDHEESMQLNGCVNDAINMKHLLEEHYEYPEQNVFVLCDEDDWKQPTCSNIINHMMYIATRSTDKDEIWIHYSGHGTFIQDQNGDEIDGQDECIIPCDYDEQGIITDDLLYMILNRFKGTVLLTMDCCHSGSICDLPFAFYCDEQNKITRVRESRFNMNNPHVYMLSGCRDNQTSADVTYGQTSEGAFTRALIDTLELKHYRVKIMELYLGVLDHLRLRGHEQRTVLSSSCELPSLLILGK